MNSSTILVLATHNKGKTAEINALLKDYPIDIRNLDDFGPIPPIVEDGATFEENAYKKASLTARYLGFAALADDSGLAVDALNGAPGVHSARYAGEAATDLQRCAKLLKAMRNQNQRQAHFACVITVAVPSGAALTYEGRCDGRITEAPVGEYGFGYDPIFLCPELGKTFAQMSMEEKSRFSHRGNALRELRNEMDKVLTWVKQQMPPQETTGCLGGPK